MKYLFLLPLLIYFCTGCNSEKNKTPQDKVSKQVYIVDSLILDEGVYIEYFDSTNTDPLRQTYDNEIYQLEKEFVFDYIQIDTLGNYNICDFATFEKRYWEWIPYGMLDSSETAITQITIKVVLNDKLEALIAQSFFEINYLNSKNESVRKSGTGIVENDKNIWGHPPRDQGFKVLEINPFPHIQKPLKIGHNWKCDLDVGSGWGDPRWKEWEGIITIKSHYEITDKVRLNSNFGMLNCWEITGVGRSEIGETKLVSYFHEKLGFVKLHYTNIDGSQLIFMLSDINNP